MLDNLMDRFMGAIIKYDDPAQKLNSIEERLVSFISNNYKKAYRYHAEGQPDIYRLYLRLLLVYGLYLRNDRQLCEEVVSGIECDYGIKENISE